MVIRRSIIILLILASFTLAQSVSISPFNFYNISDSSGTSGSGSGSGGSGGSGITHIDDIFASADRLIGVEAGSLVDSAAGKVTAWYDRWSADSTTGFTQVPVNQPDVAYITTENLAYPDLYSGSSSWMRAPYNDYVDVFNRSSFTVLQVVRSNTNSTQRIFWQWYQNFDYLLRTEMNSDGTLRIAAREPSSSLIYANFGSYPPTTVSDSIIVCAFTWDFATKTFTGYAQGNKTPTVMAMMAGATVDWYSAFESIELAVNNAAGQDVDVFAFYVLDGVQSDVDINSACVYLADKFEVNWTEIE